MMKLILASLFLIPVLGGTVIYLLKGSVKTSTRILALCAFLYLGAALKAFFHPGSGNVLIPSYLELDSHGELFLLITGVLFTFCSCHILSWLPAEEAALQKEGDNSNALMKSHTFCALLCGFLFSMTLVIFSRNFGMLWVAIESTTILSAPLILYHRSVSSLEAMWKYLLICSVGIALALFGTMLFALASSVSDPLHRSATLSFDELYFLRGKFDPGLLKGAFIFILAGYGTKMGLAPFHTWLPDAHSEAPGPVSALLSGALLNCSFLGILRFLQVMPENLMSCCNNFLLVFGFLSLGTAACFLIRQNDFKRMLAYSSVEHMGILAILLAVSPELSSPLWKLHAAGHSLLKMSLFLIAGNLLIATGTRHIPSLGGLSRPLKKNCVLWVTGLLMICGMPPSPLFFTEFLMLFQLKLPLAALALFLLFAVFAGMSYNMLSMVMGQSREVQITGEAASSAEKLWKTPLLALTLAVAGGITLLYILLDQLPCYSTFFKTWEM
jgi:hydrogenase-4 component F